jgi:hypothetical protein
MGGTIEDISGYSALMPFFIGLFVSILTFFVYLIVRIKNKLDNP